MTNAKSVPPVTEGSGRVVSAAPVSQPQQTSSRQTRQFRRTNLLSALSSEERRCFLQERLNQSALFRQIAATKHGVVAPIEREVLGDAPSEEEYRETSQSRGISIEEVRRLEKLARREAMIEVREEVLRRTKARLDDEAPSEPAPPDDEPSTPDEPSVPAGIPEAEVLLREELARREVELTNQEEALRQCQEAAEIRERASTEAARRSREEADIQRREEQDKENAIRAGQEQERREKDALRRNEQAAADRQRQEKAKGEAQLREMEEAQQRLAAAAERKVAERQRQHDQRMEELERQRKEAERHSPDLPDSEPEPHPKPKPSHPAWKPVEKVRSWFRKHDGVGGSGINGIIVGVLLVVVILWLVGFWSTPPTVQQTTTPLTRLTAEILEALKRDPSLEYDIGKISEAPKNDLSSRVDFLQQRVYGKEQPDLSPVPEGDLEQ